jgi:hypothetical protein
MIRKQPFITLLGVVGACLLVVFILSGKSFTAHATIDAPDNVPYFMYHQAEDSPFAFRRFDGEYSQTTETVFFLGGRLQENDTSGAVWEFDRGAGIYTGTGAVRDTPISN